MSCARRLIAAANTIQHLYIYCAGLIMAGCRGPHLWLPLHADGIQAVLCHWLQQATVPQLPLQLHPQRELPGGAPPAGAPVRPAPVQPQANHQGRLVCCSLVLS